MTAKTASKPLRRSAAVPRVSDADLCINTIRTLAINAVQNRFDFTLDLVMEAARQQIAKARPARN